MKLSALLLTALLAFAFTFDGEKKTNFNFFPVNNGMSLLYESSFGECLTKYYKKNDLTVSASISEKFKYKQSFVVRDSGVYVKETYQYLKILGLFTKEANITYQKPLLRFPLPLSPGMKWQAQGIEYHDGEEGTVKISGHCSGKEFVQTKAGKYEAVKIETIIEGSSGSKNRVTEWYVDNIGLVKAKIIIEGGGITGTLRDMLGYGEIQFNLKALKKQ